MTTHSREPDFADVAEMIVGVGASAGGLEAFKRLLGSLSPATGLAFILVQHFDPQRTSLLAEILASNTSLSVVEVHDGQPLLADTVYVARPGTVCGVEDGWRLSVRANHHADDRLRPVDHLFEALAASCSADAVGIVLSGAGQDGTAGLRALRASGALTLVQSPATASHPGMPTSAIEAGVVDRVLPIEAMPAALEQVRIERETLQVREQRRRAVHRARRAAALEPLTDDQLASLIELLSTATRTDADLDVRDLSPTALARRVHRRMELLGIETVGAYLERLAEAGREVQSLTSELRAGTTCFFRDPEVFETVARCVIGPLVANASPREGVRVWVPGCSTGEEAWSIVMLLLEACTVRGTTMPLQVFATDVDRHALDDARRGRFPASIASRVGDERLARFFVPVDADAGYRVTREMRDVVSFAAHDLQRDPPFSRMDLVSCRNVLDLFSATTRDRVVRALHFALRVGGVLWLGAHEAPPRLENAFETLDADARLYRRRDDTSLLLDSPAFWASRRPSRRRPPLQAQTNAVRRDDASRDTATQQAQLAILSLIPAALVVDANDDIVYTCGDLDAFVRFPSGEPHLGLFSVLHEALAVRVRAAVNRCRSEQTRVVIEVLTEREAAAPLRIEVDLARGFDEGAVVIGLFDTGAARAAHAAAGAGEADGEELAAEVRVARLAAELAATRADLARSLDELGRANEELRSSNEAALAMNEELQASNEELEATTEELTSVNDELEAVNTTLSDKVLQLELAHDDLRNFFASTRLATLFLDDTVHVRRASPAAMELLDLEPGDVGRRLETLAARVALLGGDLEEVARRVIDDLVPHDDEIEPEPGRWIARSVLPYRTASRRIAGVVVNFVDISELKRGATRLDLRARQQAVVARLGMRALRDPDMSVFSERVVRAVQQALSSDSCELLELMSDGRRLRLRTAIERGDGDGDGDGEICDIAHDDPYLPVGANLLASAALDSDESVYMTDLHDERAPQRRVAAALACAVRDGDVPYGVLCVYSHRQAVLTRDDGDFVRAVANVMGTFVTRLRANQRLAIERGVAQVLAAATDFGSAVESIIGVIANELGSTVGELWEPDAESLGELRCTRFVTPRTPRRAVALRERLASRGLRPGEGLVGQAWERGEPLWLTDADDASRFARLPALRAEGLHMGFAVPIIGARDETFAVLCFFSPSMAMAPDVAFMHTLKATGRAIGEFVLRTRAQQRLAEQSAELETVYASLPVGVFVVDRQGRILKINPRMTDIDPSGADTWVGRPVSELWPELAERIAALTERITNTLEPVRHVELELHSHDGGGACFWSCSFAPIVEPTLGAVAISCVVEDITDRKRYEGALREAARQKDQFMAMLGHELRNPLAAIRSSAELLARRHPDDPGLQRTQAVLNRQSAHMARLVDGLLDVSRIASGKLQLEREVLDLREVLEEMLDEFRVRLEGREIELQTDIASVPLWVEGDRVRLVQVLDNLLGNALKFTAPPGIIEICAERIGNGDGRVRVSVRDTGAGIAPEILPVLFEPFQQAPQDLARSSGGLGLGLSLVKGIVEQHDGTIEAHSEGLGRGAEFVVELPLADAPRDIAPAMHDTSSALRILIVEDHRDAAEILRDLLELEGHEVWLVDRGDRALDAIREHRPDVVLCDLGLPGMSGYEVARAVRADDRLAHTPMVALTGYGQKEDRIRSRQAGFDEHLTKPIDLDTLGQVVSRVVQAPAGRRPGI